jgi:hypothetical protein
VLGAAATAARLLEQTISIVGRIIKAQERQKSLVGVLESHNKELASTKEVAQLIVDERALRTAAVASQLVKIDNIAQKLVEHLCKMDPGQSSSMRRLAHQLVHGSKEEKALSDLMSELESAKSSLVLHIQVAHVGVSRSTQDDLVANVALIRRVDATLEKVFGDGQGLRIAKTLENEGILSTSTNIRKAYTDIDVESVQLNKQDIARMNDACFDSERAAQHPTSRIVVENLTIEQALQINGPIGEDGWMEASHLVIKQNKASGSSIQVNHAISKDDFQALLAARLPTIK